MRYRELGSTGLKISEVGFGSWAIGGKWWGPQDDEDSKAALRKALDLGCNFIDTAWVYGDGHSERLIGEVLKGRVERPYVATKVPPKNWNWDPPSGTPLSEAFPSGWVRTKCEESLVHLGIPRVEVLQLHTWSREWNDQADDLLTQVDRLKKEGKIRAFGLSLRDKGSDEADLLVQRGHVDTIQFFFNLLYQEPLRGLVPMAGKYGVGLIARVPLAFGALTGKFDLKTRFKGDDHRKRLYAGPPLKETLAKVKELEGILPRGMSLAEAAVKWTLAYPQISCAIPGIRNEKQAVQNCSAGEGPVWTDDEARKAEALYLGNFNLPIRKVSSTKDVHAVFMSGVALSAPRRETRPRPGRQVRTRKVRKAAVPRKTARRRPRPRRRKG